MSKQKNNSGSCRQAVASAFASLMLSLLASGPSKAAPAPSDTSSKPDLRIAITMDDLPFIRESLSLAELQAHTHTLLDALIRHHVQAVGFVNEDKLYVPGEVDARIGLLDDWLNAGMELGNHNYGHLGFHGTTLADYEDAVIRGETVTRWLTQRHGQPLRYYRHPYCQTGDNPQDKAAFEAFLHTHGYQVAPITMEHDDFVYAHVYDQSLAKQQPAVAAKVRAAYLAHLDQVLPVFEQMSQEQFGRQIPQILLIHATRLNTDTLDAMLTAMEAHGYRFIPLAEALADPVYQLPDAPSGQYGMSWLARWARATGKRLSTYGQPDPETWISDAEAALPPVVYALPAPTHPAKPATAP